MEATFKNSENVGKNINNFVVPFEVDITQLFANDYNPNRMPREEMRLLKESVSTYGFLFPIVTTLDKERSEQEGKPMYRIIDGYHRFETLKASGWTKGWIVDLGLDLYQCVQLTVLMNRIKGMHQVEKMSELVVKLEELGLDDEAIASNLGMEDEELLRLKQQLGISHTCKDVQYAKSWEIDESQA